MAMRRGQSFSKRACLSHSGSGGILGSCCLGEHLGPALAQGSGLSQALGTAQGGICATIARLTPNLQGSRPLSSLPLLIPINPTAHRARSVWEVSLWLTQNKGTAPQNPPSPWSLHGMEQPGSSLAHRMPCKPPSWIWGFTPLPRS